MSTLFSFFENTDVSTEPDVSTPLFDEVLTHQGPNLHTTFEFFNINPPVKQIKPKPPRSRVCTCEHGQNKHVQSVGGCSQCECSLFHYVKEQQ